MSIYKYIHIYIYIYLKRILYKSRRVNENNILNKIPTAAAAAAAGPAGAPLLPLLPLPWYLIHSCSLPYVIYSISDLICYSYRRFYFSLIFIIGDRWWWLMVVGGGRRWW